MPANTELTSNLSVDNEDINDIAKNNMLRYVAKRQNSSVPFLPIRGEKECRLVHQKLNDILARGESLNNQTVFENLSTEWNTHHVSVSNKIYPKMPYHFSWYVKSWSKNQDRRDAEIASGSNRLYDALKKVVPAPITESLVPAPLHSNQATTNAISDNGMEILCTAVDTHAAIDVRPSQHRKKKKRVCRTIVDNQSCPSPDICPGRFNRKNCF